MDIHIFFLILLLVVAFLYASVGHGGASGYLALMALFGFAPEVMKPTALLLNVFVSLIAFMHYYRSGNFSLSLFLPLAIASVPAAFLGGYITPGSFYYKQTLGALLLIPSLRFIIPSGSTEIRIKKVNVILALLIGASIGLLSGMIGIGGGIILSPLLLILGWADIKQTAAVSSLFIFVNSLSGLGGQFQHGLSFSTDMLLMVCIALAGGLAGGYAGAFYFNNRMLKLMLGIVLIIASIKLLMA